MIKRTVDNVKAREYPIVRFWYTKHAGRTIEEIIDKDLDFFLWVVSTFQNVTPRQAEYFTKKTGKTLNPIVIDNVEPYEYVKGDPEEMYAELCSTHNLQETIIKYRGVQTELF